MTASDILVPELGISRSCRLLGIARRTYYNRKGFRNVHERSSRIDESTVNRIDELSQERITYGYRRIWALLRNEGVLLNPKTVMRIMRSHGLLLRPHSRRKKSRNHLTRAGSPGEVWETDLTYIPTQNEGMTYLFNVKDTFTKEWMGYFYSRTCNRLDALMSVEDAITRHPDRYPDGKVPGTVLICDNGDQYTSHYFMGSVKLLGFRIEFIEKSTPQQNGDVESFHNSLKSDYVWTDDFIGYNDAGKKIKTAFQDYNNVRPHSTVDYLPPSVFRDRFLEDEHFRKYYIDRRKEKEERYKMRKEKARRLEHKLEVNSGHA